MAIENLNHQAIIMAEWLAEGEADDILKLPYK